MASESKRTVLVAFGANLLIALAKLLLIGEAAEPALVVGVHDRLMSYDEVSSVVELLTMHLGPDSVLVAARIDLADSLSGQQVEEFSERADQQLRQDFPLVTQVFLDATPDEELRQRTSAHIRALRSGTEKEAPATTGAH